MVDALAPAARELRTRKARVWRAPAKAMAKLRLLSPKYIPSGSDARRCRTSSAIRSARWRASALAPLPDHRIHGCQKFGGFEWLGQDVGFDRSKGDGFLVVAG
jgi:hypothetical protein